MLRQGVHGYLLKTTGPEILAEAINSVHNGGQYIQSSVNKKIQNLNTRIQQTVSARSMLTIREKEILQLIVNGHTDIEISEKLFLSTHTVKNYRLNIIIKLDAKNTASLVKKALQLGIVD